MFYTICSRFKQVLNTFINYCFNTADILVVVHTIIYSLVLLFLASNNLFVNMLTINGVINAVRFIKTLYENKSQDLYAQYKLNEVLENDHIMHKLKSYIDYKYPIYNNHFNFLNDGYISITQKYFLFVVVQIISYIINTTLWFCCENIINGILLLLALPLFNVLIINSIYFTITYAYFADKIRHISVYTLSKITTKVINTISETCLDHKIKLDFIEFMDFFENYEHAIVYIMIFLKTVIIQSIIHYIKTTNNIFYYYIIDIIHRYQIEKLVFFGRSDNLLGFEKQKDMLINIIKNRKWDELLKPKTVYILFEFYESKNDNKFLIKVGMLFRNIRINFIRFMTLWSISTISPIVAIMMDIYYAFFNKRFYINHTVICYLIGVITLCYYNNLIGAILIVLSDVIVKSLLDYIDDYKIIQKYIFRLPDQIKYLFFMPVISYLTYPTIIIPLLMFYINSNVILNSALTIVIMFGILSTYNIYHQLFVWFIINTISNIIINNNTKETQNLQINLLENYIKTSEPIVQLKKRRIDNIVKINTDSTNEKTIYNICERVTYIFKR